MDTRKQIFKGKGLFTLTCAGDHLRKQRNPSIENIYTWVTFISFLFLFGIYLNDMLQLCQCEMESCVGESRGIHAF